MTNSSKIEPRTSWNCSVTKNKKLQFYNADNGQCVSPSSNVIRLIGSVAGPLATVKAATVHM